MAQEGHARIAIAETSRNSFSVAALAACTAKPFTTVGRARLMPGDELMEYICNENDQDFGHYSGPPHLPTDGIVPERPAGPARR